MINFRPSDASKAASPSSVTAEKAFSWWREVKDSADADFRLMKDRANSFKNLAFSFDRELENFLNSASRSTTFSSVPAITGSSTPPADIDFVKRLQPKLTEFSRAYSSPEFSRRVLEKWSPRAKIRIDLSAIKNAIVSEVEEFEERDRFRRRPRVMDFRWEWKGEEEEDDGQSRYWEPIRALKTRLRELEQKSSSLEVMEGFKTSEFVEKLKSGLAGSFRVNPSANSLIQHNPTSEMTYP